MSFFNIIIPCYNCMDTIDRLLKSIDNQKEDITVYLEDDSDTEALYEYYLGNMKELYPNIPNIIYNKRDDNYISHAPGFTRHSGLNRVIDQTGSWVCFADNDDEFEPDVFSNIRKIIEENKEELNTFIVSNFVEYNEEENLVREHIQSLTWLHGKFYSIDWLRDNNINFSTELQSHEDLYFNCQSRVSLILNEQSYYTTDLYTYIWYVNPNSESRQYDNSSDGHKYLELYFKDYIKAASDPFFNNKELDTEVSFTNCSAVLLHCYFYYQALIYEIGEENILPHRLDYIKELYYKIMNNFNKSKNDILAFIYANPQHYEESKAQAKIGTGDFIESKSFIDFINSL